MTLNEFRISLNNYLIVLNSAHSSSTNQPSLLTAVEELWKLLWIYIYIYISCGNINLLIWYPTSYVDFVLYVSLLVWASTLMGDVPPHNSHSFRVLLNQFFFPPAYVSAFISPFVKFTRFISWKNSWSHQCM